jgi:hypothetical protein
MCNVKLGKATGVDKIPNEILKCPRMTDILHQLFCCIFRQGKMPSVWNDSIIHPIHKPGKDRNYALSFRGISLNSTVNKVYSSVLNNRLMRFIIDEQGLLVDEQNGFRPKRSCEAHLYSLTTIVRNRNQQKKTTFVCFIDFSKAFDSINRKCLITKLYNLAVSVLYVYEH